MHVSKHLVHCHIIRQDPAYPREVAEHLEQVPRQKVPWERTEEHEKEQSLSADTPMITDTGVRLRMQSIE